MNQKPSMPFPSYLIPLQSVKALCAEGRWFESQGKNREALDNYLTALTMGRDYASPDCYLISHLIGTSFASIANARILDLVAGGKLGRTDLERCGKRLAAIEKTYPHIAHAFRCESGNWKWTLNRIKEGDSLSPREMLLAKKIVPDIDAFDAENDRLWAYRIKQIETPWWERDKEAFEKEWTRMLDTCHPLLRDGFPDFFNADARYLTVIAGLRQARLAPALEAYRLDRTRYPKSLEDLAPRYIDEMPVDPFSGKPFRYESNRSSYKGSYKIWSIGPDSRDDSGELRFDPTNGTFSKGDIVFGK